MAKPKNSRLKYTSKGVHSAVSSNTKNAIRRDYMASGNRTVEQQKAYNAGKKVMITMDNPNKNETNKRTIRVDASTIWRAPLNKRRG